MKKTLAMILTLVMALAMCPTALAIQTEPFAEETVQLTAAIPHGNFAEGEENWFYNFAKNVLNIDVQVEYTADRANYVQLSFASGNMPDMYLSMGLSTIDMMNYGASEQQLVKIDELIAGGKMPNLAAAYEKYPNARSIVTAPDGHIYATGIIRETGLVDCRMYYNSRWLDAVGAEYPATLDELNTVMYAMKEHFGEKATPLGGGYKTNNPCAIILNAMGYLTRQANGLGIALRNGQPVFPYGDREVFGEYLKLMNQYYTDGIISQDFFTMDGTTYKALALEDTMFLTTSAPYTVWADTFDEWEGIMPLTSEWNDTQNWPNGKNVITAGQAAISTNCDNVDAAAFFIDWVYNQENYVLTAFGPRVSDDEWKYGVTGGWTMDDTYYSCEYPDMKEKGYDSPYSYQVGKIYMWHEGNFGFETNDVTAPALMGYQTEGRVYDLSDGDDNYRATITANLQPFATPTYPVVSFFSAEQSEAITDLKTVLESYAEAEIAKFITGARPLEEIDRYFDELDSLGFQEYLGYHVDYYNNMAA